MQMGVHSTLGSYLHRLIIGLTGSFGREGTSYAFVPFRPLGGGAAAGSSGPAQAFGDTFIPTCMDHDPRAQLRRPMVMMRQGWSMSLFQASQQWSTMLS